MKVWPKNDSLRSWLKHPTGVGFSTNPELDPADWPQDQFTTRRIQDGDVLDHPPPLDYTPAPEAKEVKATAKKVATEEKK